MLHVSQGPHCWEYAHFASWVAIFQVSLESFQHGQEPISYWRRVNCHQLPVTHGKQLTPNASKTNLYAKYRISIIIISWTTYCTPEQPNSFTGGAAQLLRSSGGNRKVAGSMLQLDSRWYMPWFAQTRNNNFINTEYLEELTLVTPSNNDIRSTVLEAIFYEIRHRLGRYHDALLSCFRKEHCITEIRSAFGFLFPRSKVVCVKTTLLFYLLRTWA